MPFPGIVFRHRYWLSCCVKSLGVLRLPHWDGSSVKRDEPATLPRQLRTHLQQFRRQRTLPTIPIACVLPKTVHFRSLVPVSEMHAQQVEWHVSPCARPALPPL